MDEKRLKEEQGGTVKTVLRKWGPWLVTAAIFYFVFQRVPIEKVVDAAIHVDLRIFLPLLIANLIIHFLWDILVYTSVTYTEMMPVRGASYMLMVLNFFVGQGGFALLISRWKRLPIKRVTSILLFTMFNDYYLLLAFCLVGAFRLPDVDLSCFFKAGEKGDLVRFIVISWAYFWIHIGFYRWHLPRTKRLQQFKQSEIASAFLEAPTTLYFKLGAIKLVNFFAGIFICYFALAAFGIKVPLIYLFTFLPIVWLIGSIPVTVMGFGTTQAAMIWLVAGFAQGTGSPQEIEAAVVAYSLLWSFFYGLGNLGAGAICVSRLPKRIWMPIEMQRQNMQTPSSTN